jgi:hypothetical protein
MTGLIPAANCDASMHELALKNWVERGLDAVASRLANPSRGRRRRREGSGKRLDKAKAPAK